MATGYDTVLGAFAVGANVDQVCAAAHPSECLAAGEPSQSRAGAVEQLVDGARRVGRHLRCRAYEDVLVCLATPRGNSTPTGRMLRHTVQA